MTLQWGWKQNKTKNPCCSDTHWATIQSCCDILPYLMNPKPFPIKNENKFKFIPITKKASPHMPLAASWFPPHHSPCAASLQPHRSLTGLWSSPLMCWTRSYPGVLAAVPPAWKVLSALCLTGACSSFKSQLQCHTAKKPSLVLFSKALLRPDILSVHEPVVFSSQHFLYSEGDSATWFIGWLVD